MRRTMYVALLLVAGCQPGTVNESADSNLDAYVPPYAQTLPDGPCAIEGVTGTIAGVSLTIRGDSCVFHRGTGGSFVYEVTTTASTPPITTPDSGGGCGLCSAFSSDPLSFTRYVIYGTSAGDVQQQYCFCDTGCCPPTTPQQVQVDATTRTFSFEWSGRTWGGPSDTDSPMGDFFLPGRYAVHVGFNGYDAGQVVAELPIEVVP